MSAQERDPLAAQQAREQGEAVTARYQAAHERIIKEGRHIDVKDAMARCFAAGNHGTEKLNG